MDVHINLLAFKISTTKCYFNLIYCLYKLSHFLSVKEDCFNMSAFLTQFIVACLKYHNLSRFSNQYAWNSKLLPYSDN